MILHLLCMSIGFLFVMPSALWAEETTMVFVPLVVNSPGVDETHDEDIAPLPDEYAEYEWSVITRLRPVGQGDQACTGGSHQIVVTVLDAAGHPVNGVRVKEVFTGSVKHSGDSGPGRAVWDIYRGGGGQVQLVDRDEEPLSPVSAGMSADWPAFGMIWEAGYCNCKPHPDAASCEEDLNNKTYLFAVGHYTYDVIFYQRYIPFTSSQAAGQARRVANIQPEPPMSVHLPK